MQGVEIPETRINISERDYQQLCESIDVSREVEDYGVSLYEETVQFLQNECPSLS